MRLASWNVNGLDARTPSLLRWLAERQPFVVGLQELKTSGSAPLRRFEDVGYHVAATERVALLSVGALTDVTYPTGDGRTVAATVDGLRIINTYAPNGYKAGTERHLAKVQWLSDFGPVVAGEADRADHLVVIGDFNVARGPLDVWAPDNYRGRNLFTSAERAAFESIIADNDLSDLLREKHEGPGLYTWFNYAHQALARNRGWRLDYVLATAGLASKLDHAVVDVEERGRTKTSDHAPIWVDVDY